MDITKITKGEVMTNDGKQAKMIQKKGGKGRVHYIEIRRMRVCV